MRLLVTRPQPDADRCAAALRAAGHEVIVAPLLHVVFHSDALPDLAGAQALIATSRNGLRALEASGRTADVGSRPVFAVGPGTRRTAREIGLCHVVEGCGTALDLVPAIAQACTPAAGPLVHLAGEKRTAGLKEALVARGFTVYQPVLYRTGEAGELGLQAHSALAERRLDGVVLMSPASADVFTRLVNRAGLHEAVASLTFFCISANVADVVARHFDGRLKVSQKPNSQEILALINRQAAQLP